jgi:MerR family transcriptional regulator, copper efflux regulator
MAPSAAVDLVQIGVMAERVGLSLRTVRYYEEMGLVEPTTRTAGGFRLYGPEQEERLRVLKTMKPLGFTLDEMRDLVQLLDDAARAKPRSRRAMALRERIDALRQEIALRRANLLDQVDATTRISSALDVAARHLA